MSDRSTIARALTYLVARRPESLTPAQHARRILHDLTAPRPGSRRRTVIGPADLDAMVARSDAIGPPGSAAVAAYWQGLAYRPGVAVDQSLDPLGQPYVDQQVALFRELSGRDVDQAVNEMTSFDIDAHLGTPNPYGTWEPGAVALHVVRVARAVEQAGLGLGQHVLDLGCGWGTTGEVMAFLGLRVTGLDINADFVSLVNRRAGRLANGVAAVRGTFEDIPGDETYDAALFYESLHHAVRPWDSLAAVHARLRPGGTLMLAGEPVSDEWRHWGIRTDFLSIYCIRKFGWFESGWSPAFIEGCVARAGFAVEYFKREPGSIGWIMVARKPG